MHALYKAIDDYNAGLFELMVGTDKTLSIICPTLTLLQPNRVSTLSSLSSSLPLRNNDIRTDTVNGKSNEMQEVMRMTENLLG